MRRLLLIFILIPTLAYGAPLTEGKIIKADANRKTADSVITELSGNIGVGSANPRTTLDVNGTATATAFVGDGSGLTGISAGASGWTDSGTSVYTTTSTDNVGIGTTTPLDKLDVSGAIKSWNSPYAFNNDTTVYEGLVATRGLIPYQYNSGVTTAMSRSIHMSTEPINKMKIVIPNWYSNSSSPYQELGTGSTATVTASIEYPSGTFNQVTFNGSTSGSIPSGTSLVSDYITLSTPIPTQTKFYIRIYFVNSGGFVYESYSPTTGVGGGFESGGADKTMSGTVSGSSSNLSPTALVGFTNKASVLILGDSRCAGFTDTTANANLEYGDLSPLLQLNYGYIQSCRGSDEGRFFLTSGYSPERLKLWKYATHIINGYGYNDWLNNYHTAAGVIGITNQIVNLAHNQNKKIYNVTIGAKTTSTDSWATTANQTVTAYESERILYNAWVRNGGNGQDGYIDVADDNESSRDSGKWKVDGTAFKYTPDGIHENSFANQSSISTSTTIPNFITPISYKNGNVGINTTIPISKLQVVGTVTATAFVGDGTGITGISGGSVGWTDGGTNVYTTTTTDNVGIGTTTPNSTTLEIVKNAAQPPLKVSSTALGNGDYLVVNSGGNVGIGSINPSNNLYVFGSASNADLGVFKSASTVYSGIVLSNTSSGGQAWKILSSGSGLSTGVGKLLFNNGSNRFTIDSSGNIGIGTTSTGANTLSVSGTMSLGSAAFSQRQSLNGGLLVEGNVGIGTYAPGSALDIGGTGSKLRMRSPDGTYWNCQPADTTGVFTCT